MSYDCTLINPVTGETGELRGSAPVESLEHKDGIQSLNGMTARNSAPLLLSAILKLDMDTEPDYWKATEGNARRALVGLLGMALELPDHVWQIN